MNVLTEDEVAVRVITLNRPERRNAIDIPLRLELAEALIEADADCAVRVIVLTGAGSTFCSGGDITTMQLMSERDAMDRAQLAQRVIRAIWNSPKPVIAAVEGAAFGAGAALAAACDRVVASESTRFSTTFTNVGLAGDMGTFVSLPRRVGIARARQMLLLPEPMNADEAKACGLVDEVVQTGKALEAALSDAHRLAAGPAQAYGAIKSLLAMAPTMGPEEVLDLEAENQARLFGSDDFAEGVAAFKQKRRPVFSQGQGVHP